MRTPANRIGNWRSLSTLWRSAFSRSRPSALRLAAAHIRVGEIDRAISDYDEAIRQNPRYVRLYFDRGTVHLNKRDYGRAMADYRELLKLDPSAHFQGLVWLYLAQAHQALGQTSEARQWLATSLAWFNKADKMTGVVRITSHDREWFQQQLKEVTTLIEAGSAK